MYVNRKEIRKQKRSNKMKKKLLWLLHKVHKIMKKKDERKGCKKRKTGEEEGHPSVFSIFCERKGEL